MSNDLRKQNNEWISGHVIRGAGRGEELGFPTANLQIPEVLDEGIFAVWVRLDNTSTPLPAVMHVGPKPVFEEVSPSVEIHIFDFNQDLYGQTIQFQIVQKLRDVKNFDTVQELVDAIDLDCKHAKDILLDA